MPQLERIRIVGLQYEKMIKKYDDFMLDLAHEDLPKNTLVTLANGGGKGVLLQSIFQVLIPKTPWGKESENHVESFFYNYKHNLRPYTFHVALEWRLDNPDKIQYLTTAIAMTASSQSENQEAKVDYILYALVDYDDGSALNIETLPLYNNDTLQVTPFDEIVQYVKSNRNLIVTFASHSSDLKKYYEFLAERDIHISEWRNMQKINGEEGGIKGYFQKHDAFTNTKLFENLIIPEIGSGLNELYREDHFSLQNMFLDSAIVAQRLPQLEQREQAYQEFVQLSNPLYEQVCNGLECQETLKSNILTGSHLLSATQFELKLKETDIVKYSSALSNYEAEAKDLQFEAENLKYLLKKESLDHNQFKLSRLDDDVQRAKNRLMDSENKEKELQIDLFLAKRSVLQRSINELKNDIEVLKNSAEFKEQHTAVEMTRKELEEEWNHVRTLWLRVKTYFKLAMEETEQELDQNDKQRSMNEREIGGIERELNKLTSDIRTYNEDFMELSNQYGHDFAAAPSNMLEQIENELYLIKEQINCIDLKINELKTDFLQQNQKDTSITIELNHAEKKKSILMTQLKEQQDRENHLWSEIVVCLKLFDDHTEMGTSSLFLKEEKIRTRILQEIESIRLLLIRGRREYFGQLIDMELQQSSYWVPNSDLLAAKDSLDSVKVSCTLGAAYLSELTPEQRDEELFRHPLLPYSLLITEKDVPHIQMDALKSLLAKCPVPIYIREQMSEKDKTSYLLLESQHNDLLNPESFSIWKSCRKEELNNAEQKVKEAEATIHKLLAIQKEYEQLFLNDNSKKLILQLEEISKLIEELKQHKVEMSSQLASNKSQQMQYQKEINDSQDKRDNLEKQQLMLIDWIMRSKQNNLHLSEKKRWVMALEDLERVTKNLEQQSNTLKEQQNFIHIQESQWTGMTKHTIFPRLQVYLPDVTYPQLTTELLEPLSFHSDLDEQSTLVKLLTTLEGMHSTLSENELQIRLKEREILSNRKQIEDLEKSLGRIESKWIDRPEPLEPTDAIEIQQISQKRSTQFYSEDYQKVREQYVILEDNVNRLKDELIHLKMDIKRAFPNREIEYWTGSLENRAGEIKTLQHEVQNLIQSHKKMLSDLEKTKALYYNQYQLLSHLVDSPTDSSSVPQSVRDSVINDLEVTIKSWMDSFKEIQGNVEDVSKLVKVEKNTLTKLISKSGWNAELEVKIIDRLNMIVWEDFENAQSALSAMQQSSIEQIQMIQSDKENMEVTRKLWANRAGKRVIQILDILKRMERKMVIQNQNGYNYPLVIFNYKNITVPKNTEDVEPLLMEYFNRCIHELLQKYTRVEQASKQDIKERINDGRIVLIALQNRFPILQVYKPTTDNFFIYAKPEDYHYSDWEIINKGALTEAVGSGGQKQSVQLIVAMMIMTHKRVNRENKGWTVFIYDNPFGEMVSKNVLDPVFEISKALRFQWLIVTPPELVKNDVSTRFGVYWELSFNGSERNHVISTLIKGGRKVVPLTLF